MVVDASVWVSSLITHDIHHQMSQRWLRRQTASSVQLIIPSIALPEIAGSIARRELSSIAGHEAIRWILRISGLQIVSIHEDLGRSAARMAADYRLRGADSIYVAVADELGLPLVTWDQELHQRAASIVSAIYP